MSRLVSVLRRLWFLIVGCPVCMRRRWTHLPFCRMVRPR